MDFPMHRPRPLVPVGEEDPSDEFVFSENKIFPIFYDVPSCQAPTVSG